METDQPYSFERRFEHTSEGGSAVWIIIDASRGDRDPLATCNAPEDAMFIASALNQMHREGSL